MTLTSRVPLRSSRSRPTAPTKQDELLISELNIHIPLIVFPRPTQHHGIFSSQEDVQATPLPLLHTPTPPSVPQQQTASSLIGHTSTIRPDNPFAFRISLLRSPGTLSTLRLEAVDRFLRWREVEKGVDRVLGISSFQPPALPLFTYDSSPSSSPRAFEEQSLSGTLRPPLRADKGKGRAQPLSSSSATVSKWDKGRWEAEWEDTLSSEIVKTVRQRRGREGRQSPLDRRGTVTAQPRPRLLSESTTQTRPYPLHHGQPQPQSDRPQQPWIRTRRRAERPQGSLYHDPQPQILRDNLPITPTPISFDPLHLPSLFAFSISLLSPLRARLFSAFSFSSKPKQGHAYPDDEDRGYHSNGSGGPGWGLVLGAFCAGLGIGFVISSAGVVM